MMTHHTRERATGFCFRPFFGLTGALTAGLLLSGCGGIGPVVDQTSPASSSASAAAGTLGAAPTASPSGAAGRPSPSATPSGMFAPEPPPQLGQGVDTSAPVWDARAAQDAEERALEVMVAFTNTKASKNDWVARIKPMLTNRAQNAWSDPGLSAFTATGVTGPARLELESPPNPYWVWAVVPTNDGDYRVRLNKAGPASHWLADIIRPAQLKK